MAFPDRMDRDRLNSVPAWEVAGAALNVLDRLSDHDKETQGAALALTALAYARRHGMDVGDLFTVANNIMHSTEAGRTNAITALHNYVRFDT